jgi:hypothetical protein
MLIPTGEPPFEGDPPVGVVTEIVLVALKPNNI